MPTLQDYTYDAPKTHVGISDIFNCKSNEELKDLPNNIMNTEHTCQKYNIGKIFVSSIATCTRTFTKTPKINEDMKNMCISNNPEFIEHNQITATDLWKDDIHLAESGKVFLARNLLDAINIFYATAGFETQSL